MLTFTGAVGRTYGQAWRFLAALPLLALAIVGVEALQHLVEWRAGMYLSRAAASHAATDMGRMIAGSAKVLWLNLVAFWVFRFVAGGSAGAALRAGGQAIRRYAWVMAFLAGLSLVTLWPPVLAPPGEARRWVSIVELGVQLATFPLGVALTPWIVGAAVADERATMGFSLRRAWGSIWWGVALSLATTLPPMAIHYALNLGAVGKAAPVAAAMLAIDAAFVGYLGVAIATGQAVVAQRMAERAGETLRLLV